MQSRFEVTYMETGNRCKYRKRSIPRTEEIDDLKTVEYKSESRNNQQFAVVKQDLTIQWILSVWNQNFPKNGEEFTKDFGQAISHRLETRNCNELYVESRRDISRIIAIWIEWRIMMRFCKFFQFLTCDRIYITWTLSTNIVPSLFVVFFSVCPQTDTAQLYNTQSNLCIRTSHLDQIDL